MNDDTWNVGIECPEDWIPLPLEPGIDLGAWALEQAGKLAAAPAEVDADALMYDLRERAADSRGREPVFAFGLYPEGFEEALAVLEVDVVHPDDKVPSITLDWITEVFATGDFQEPEVERAVLPAGPAVRIRQGLAGRGTGQSGERSLMETVTYGVRPPGIESAVMVLVSWTAPGLADLMTTAADQIVHTLKITVT
ncbi:hypothetical protein [Streptomyces sp. RKAG293]|uniref:hypothetical protein n=1 Tax=Streptomyces sp. RKAG293 TaxID=2893403 RepID=UPI0020346B1C|nr:hypothetical protein [Streptomyces sp. RKAG293]MCM2419326.1 hypothetical protein [Streptomyces sp. RKAG293]